MTWQSADAAGTGSDLFAGGFSWGTFLLIAGMMLALAVVSSLGILARMRDRATEMRGAVPPTPTSAPAEDRSGSAAP